MGSIMNGIALHGGTRVFGGTFLVFSDYMRPAVRLAALMKLPVTYVWTHDSIGLGEDGPTHQPVEHLAALRAIPNLDVVRPADANETAAAWGALLQHTDRPTGLCLSRQNLPVLDPDAVVGVPRGGYVLAEAERDDAITDPDVILIGTGSEVSLAIAAREQLQADGVPTRVVSMPCREWFDAQDSGLPGRGAATYGACTRVGGGGRGTGVARDRRRRRADRLARALRRLRRLRDPVHAVRDHGRGRRGRGEGESRRLHRQEGPDDPGHDPPTAALSAQGVSVWLDDLSRDLLETGELSRLIRASARGRRHLQPDDLRRRAGQG